MSHMKQAVIVLLALSALFIGGGPAVADGGPVITSHTGEPACC